VLRLPSGLRRMSVTDSGESSAAFRAKPKTHKETGLKIIAVAASIERRPPECRGKLPRFKEFPEPIRRCSIRACSDSTETAGSFRTASDAVPYCFPTSGNAHQTPGAMTRHRNERHPDRCIWLVPPARRC